MWNPILIGGTRTEFQSHVQKHVQCSFSELKNKLHMFEGPHILDWDFILPPLIFSGINNFLYRYLEGQGEKSWSPKDIIF